MTTIEACEKKLEQQFKRIDDIAYFNANKVLRAFQEHHISTQHFQPTSGYGYDDIGRDTLGKVYASAFGAEEAIVSPLVTCGSHALAAALFAILRPNDLMLSITSAPYDTLNDTIKSKDDKNLGTLEDYGIKYEQVDLKNGKFDFEEIKKECSKKQPKLVFIQRSRGYSDRSALCVEEIKKACEIVKTASPKSVIMVDNCYGEFLEKQEPCEVGADLMVGSLIKNPGGGLAPSGAYFAGRKDVIEKVSARLTSPSLLGEVGSYAAGYRLFYQGFFIAPSVVASAVKGAYLIGEVMCGLGYPCFPKSSEPTYDIIKSIYFETSDELVKFVQLIQKFSPVDSFVLPLPWDMPGYTSEVIMAAGTFVSGASIELSCDSPIKAPYIAYFQGALTYEHAKIVAQNLIDEFSK